MKDFRGGWILLGALLANVAVTALITPIALIDGQERLGYVAPPASFVGVFLGGAGGGLVAARRARPAGA